MRFSTRPTLRLDEAAEWLGISQDSIEQHLAECIVRVGRTRLVVTAQIHEALARRLREGEEVSPDPLTRARAIVKASS